MVDFEMCLGIFTSLKCPKHTCYIGMASIRSKWNDTTSEAVDFQFYPIVETPCSFLCRLDGKLCAEIFPKHRGIGLAVQGIIISGLGICTRELLLSCLLLTNGEKKPERSCKIAVGRLIKRASLLHSMAPIFTTGGQLVCSGKNYSPYFLTKDFFILIPN